MSARHQAYITEARSATRQFWDAYHKLKGLQTEWSALDYGNTLSDGTDANAGYTRSEVGAVVFDTANAVATLLGSGHATNLAGLL